MRIEICLLTILLFVSCGRRLDNQHLSTLPIVREQPETMREVVTEDSSVLQGHVSPKGYRTVFLYNNKLRLSIPDYFKEMSFEMKQKKYPSRNSPDVVYTDEDGTVNVALNYTTTISDSDMAAQQISLLRQLQDANAMDLTTRTETINGSEFVVFEFVSQAIDTRVYNFMFLTELDGRMLFGTFNCIDELKHEWNYRAQEILLSVQKK